MPRVVVFLAEGFEEVEAVTPVDYLRRAGAEVVTAGVGTRTPRGARGMVVQADSRVEDLSGSFDAAVLPGGMPGSRNLAESGEVEELCRRLWKEGALIAAICAAPAVALGRFGLLSGRRFTCYPGCESDVGAGAGAGFLEERVVQDGNLITSRGAGTAGEFALRIIAWLFDENTARKVGASVLLSSPG